MRVADLALYAAKGAGRDTWRMFDPALREDAEQRLGLLADLRQALRKQEFELHFQPQVDLARGRLEGFEALVRWRHPVRGLVAPTRFIPVAEESGLILPLGGWVLREACRHALTWPADLSVAVNVSAVEFERSDLVGEVVAALVETGLPAHRLELELTESALLTDTERAVEQLQRLREIGVRVALDDFGTGFSSLAYLRQLPLDKLKIDRAFIAELDARTPGAATSAAIVTTIQNLGRALSLRTMAEGVETAAQRRMLKRLGCESGQGYWFARPLTPEMALEFIRVQAESDTLLEDDDRFTVAGALEEAPADPRQPVWRLPRSMF
jgi:EAL domain-containing protein (putative c-di-GMP-specific phosphodiesterase class I)